MSAQAADERGRVARNNQIEHRQHMSVRSRTPMAATKKEKSQARRCQARSVGSSFSETHEKRASAKHEHGSVRAAVAAERTTKVRRSEGQMTVSVDASAQATVKKTRAHIMQSKRVPRACIGARRRKRKYTSADGFTWPRRALGACASSTPDDSPISAPQQRQRNQLTSSRHAPDGCRGVATAHSRGPSAGPRQILWCH